VPVDLPRAKYDLALSLAPTPDGGVDGVLEYDADLFDAATIKRWVDYWRRTLEGMTRHPDRPVAALPLLSAAERASMAQGGRATARDVSAATLPELFEAQVARTPAATALIFGDARLTYAALDAWANRLARLLAQEEIGPESVVALALPRSMEMVAALLGVLKAGAAYAPLDPESPPERLAFMLRDCRATRLIAARETVDALRGTGAVLPATFVLGDAALQQRLATLSADRLSEAERTARPRPDNLAYLIYTSGSTGTPKPSANTHRNVSSLFAATEESFGFNAHDVWTLFHSYAFDFSVWEIWGALLYGGKLVIVPEDVRRSTADLLALIREQAVTVLNQTPAAFYALMEAERAAGPEPAPLALRYVIFGGEVLDLRKLAPWCERQADTGPRLINMYGITETTVHVTCLELDPLAVRQAGARGEGSPVGRGLPHLGVYVLDSALAPVPAGVAGELYVAGAGLARGYAGQGNRVNS
jgi:nonribosomal peptide synthetase DhbF